MASRARSLQRKARRIMATWPDPAPERPPSTGDKEVDAILFGTSYEPPPIGVYKVGTKAPERWAVAEPVAKVLRAYRAGMLSHNELRAYVGLPPVNDGGMHYRAYAAANEALREILESVAGLVKSSGSTSGEG